jgi:hypothetical protein
LSWRFVFSFPNFYLSEFSTLKKQRQDLYLIYGINFYVRSLWNSTFSGNSTNCCHPSRSITSWTSFLQRCHLRNIVFLQEDHPQNCPFYPKIFYATFTLMNNSHNNVFCFFRPIKDVMGHFECFSDVYTKSYRCSLLRPLKKTSFFELWRSGHDRFKPW